MPAKILPRRVPGSRVSIDYHEAEEEEEEEEELLLHEHDAEHLSSLTTAPNRAPPDADSSLKRLRHLNEVNQMKITKVKLIIRRVGNQAEFLVMDSKSNELYEKFRIEELKSPIYKESNDQRDYFNNLLLFNVNAHKDAMSGPSQNEMHIFQCCNVPAHVIVDEIEEAQRKPQPTIFRPARQESPKAPKVDERNISFDMEGVQETLSEYLRSENYYNKKMFSRVEGYTVSAMDDDQDRLTVTETQLEKRFQAEQQQKKTYIDAEIILLNLCFDDIESYVGNITKLQRARSLNSLAKSIVDDAASVPDKEKKKKKKRLIFKKKSSEKGKEVALPRNTSCTSLVSEVEVQISDDELIDLFEKVKFSIVLLSRLQGFVTDPNPPLLTHRLFSILQQPIQFVRDPETGKPELARRVIHPVFTEAAINLIQESLIEPEVSMWHELGDAWCVPKEQWPDNDLHEYVPVFRCGFKPVPEHYHQTLFNSKEGPDVASNDGFSTHIPNSVLPNSKRTNEEYLQYLMKRKAMIARAKRDFSAANSQEMSLTMGEYVEVLDDSRKWNRLRNREGLEGYAPFTILEFNF